MCRRREESLSRAKELEKIGSIAEARNEYYRALEITPELYVPLIRRLQALGIEYVVAPYEADAELGFLSRNNLCRLCNYGRWRFSCLWLSLCSLQIG